jgi:small-conductance mechanosensitive channel
VFIIYFLAIGYALKELGISLTAYVASASVIGLAVGFGSQGIVQDMVTGFTLIVSNQIDIGDMVEINGQTGIVNSISMRFVVFENANGANVYIPNRNINVVINYPKKHINCHVDIILPNEDDLKIQVKEKAKKMIKVVHEKYPNILMQPKSNSKILKTNLDNEVLRLIFHIWPGRGTPIESAFKQELLQAIKVIVPTYADWMISVNYEVEMNENTN